MAWHEILLTFGFWRHKSLSHASNLCAWMISSSAVEFFFGQPEHVQWNCLTGDGMMMQQWNLHRKNSNSKSIPRIIDISSFDDVWEVWDSSWNSISTCIILIKRPSVSQLEMGIISLCLRLVQKSCQRSSIILSNKAAVGRGAFTSMPCIPWETAQLYLFSKRFQTTGLVLGAQIRISLNMGSSSVCRSLAWGIVVSGHQTNMCMQIVSIDLRQMIAGKFQ